MRDALVLNYTAVLVAALIAFGLVLLLLVLSRLIAPRQYTESKATTYECGMLPLGRFLPQVHFRYYLFAILFMIFDVEVVFLYPWALVFVDMGAVAFWEMMLFMAILLFGLAYAWRKGVLQWK